MTINDILSSPNKIPSDIYIFTNFLSKGEFGYNICNIDFDSISIPNDCPISVSSLCSFKHRFEQSLPIYIVSYQNNPFALIYFRDNDSLDSTFIFNKELFIKSIHYFESLKSFDELIIYSLDNQISDLNYIYDYEDVSKLIFENNFSLSFKANDFVIINIENIPFPFDFVKESFVRCKIISTDSTSASFTYVLELIDYKKITSFSNSGKISHSYVKSFDVINFSDICPDYSLVSELNDSQLKIIRELLSEPISHPKISVPFIEEKYLSILDS